MQLASDVENGRAAVLGVQLLIGQEQVKQPGVERGVHHDLHPVARVHVRQHLEVGQRLLPDSVVRVGHQGQQQLDGRLVAHLVALIDDDALIQGGRRPGDDPLQAARVQVLHLLQVELLVVADEGLFELLLSLLER